MQKSNPTQTVNQNVSQVQIKDSRTITYVRGKEIFASYSLIFYTFHIFVIQLQNFLQSCCKNVTTLLHQVVQIKM